MVTIIASQDDVNKELGKDFVEEHRSRKQVIVSFISQADTYEYYADTFFKTFYKFYTTTF